MDIKKEESELQEEISAITSLEEQQLSDIKYEEYNDPASVPVIVNGEKVSYTSGAFIFSFRWNKYFI
jgi:hypothetical protein